MPRAPAPNWKLRTQPVLDDYVWASINAVNGVYDSETGHYGKLVYSGCETEERALEINRALNRSASYMHTHKQADVGMNSRVKRASDGTWEVEFAAVSKAHARAYVIQKYGSDRSKWPYDPRKKYGK
jgi:hypothetical protein